MIRLAFLLLLLTSTAFAADDTNSLVPDMSQLGPRVPRTLTRWPHEIYIGPRGGRYWIGYMGRKNYLKRIK